MRQRSSQNTSPATSVAKCELGMICAENLAHQRAGGGSCLSRREDTVQGPRPVSSPLAPAGQAHSVLSEPWFPSSSV